MLERQTYVRSSGFQQYDAPVWFLTILGTLLGIASIVHVYTNPEPMNAWVTEFILVGVLIALVLYGGYWMATRPLNHSDRWNIAIWSLFGGGFVGLLVTGYIVTEQIDSEVIVEPGELLLFGVFGGVVVSLYASLLNERRHLIKDLEMSKETQLTERANEHLSNDARVLAELTLDTRSRNILQVLILAETSLDVETIVSRIAAIENTDPRTVSLDITRVRLPKLENWGFIHYESDTEVVHSPDRIAQVANARDELGASGQQLASMVDR